MFFKLKNNFGEIAVFLPKFWGTLPSLNISSPPGCLLCTDHLASAADIVAGDAWRPRARKNSSGISIIVPRTLKGLTLAEKATKDGRSYTEEAGLRDLLIAYGFHVLEGKQYAPLRQRLLQHRTTVLREFNEIDKIIVLLMAIISTHLLKFKITKQLLDTSPSEKILRYISWLLSRQKYGKLSRTASFLNSPSLVTSARAYPD